MERQQVAVFDTTLRDGEQAPGCSIGVKDKLRLAWQLERLGDTAAAAGPGEAASDGAVASRRAQRGARPRRPRAAGPQVRVVRVVRGRLFFALVALRGRARSSRAQRSRPPRPASNCDRDVRYRGGERQRLRGPPRTAWRKWAAATSAEARPAACQRRSQFKNSPATCQGNTAGSGPAASPVSKARAFACLTGSSVSNE